MLFIEEIKNRAKQQIKTIILPEATDIRILKAAQIVNKEKYAKVALIGNKEEIERLIKENNLELGDTQIIDPAKSDETSEYAKELYELRKAKGMTEEQAQKLIGIQKEKRKIKFITAIALSDGNTTICKEGIVEGYVAEAPRGDNGFGFDEIFELENGKTLAELTQEEKNSISARKIALEQIKKEINNL